MTEEQRWPEPAYLTKDHAINMTLRDYAAIKMMQGMLAESGGGASSNKDLAEFAYHIADEMLKARDKK